MNPLLTKNESTFIKGVLIALVVLGHNSILSSNFPLLRQLIVPFDVTGFFLITFLYGYNNIDFFSHFKKLIKGILPMWSLVFIVYTLIYFLWSKNIPSVEEVSVAYALGGNATKEVLGFHLFWFYPAFFYFSIFKWISQQTKFAWLIYSLYIFIMHQLAFRGTVYLLKLFPFYQNKPINVILGILSYIVAILIPIIVYNAYLKLKDYAFPRKVSQIN